MSQVFVFPTDAQDLETHSREHFYVQNRVPIAHKNERDLSRMLADLLDRFDEAGSSPLLCTNEVFDVLYSFTQDFALLKVPVRVELVRLFERVSFRFAGDLRENMFASGSLESAELAQAIPMFIFLITNLSSKMHKDHLDTLVKNTTISSTGSKRVTKAKKPSGEASWDVVASMERVAVAMHTIISCPSLSRPFDGGVLPLAISSRAFKGVCELLQHNEYVKPAASHDCIRQTLFSIFAICIGSYKVDDEFETFFRRVLDSDSYNPVSFAHLFIAAVKHNRSEAPLRTALTLLGEMRVGSEEKGFTQLGPWLEELVDKLPGACYRCVSTVLLQLGAEHHAVRNAVVMFLAKLVSTCFDADGDVKASVLVKVGDGSLDAAEEEEEEEEELRVKTSEEVMEVEDGEEEKKEESPELVKEEEDVYLSRDELIEILLDRTMDLNALCRARVLSCFTTLARQACLGGQKSVKTMMKACERMSDRTVNVRKNAIVLATALLENFPRELPLPVEGYEEMPLACAPLEFFFEKWRNDGADMEQRLGLYRQDLIVREDHLRELERRVENGEWGVDITVGDMSGGEGDGEAEEVGGGEMTTSSRRQSRRGSMGRGAHAHSGGMIKREQEQAAASRLRADLALAREELVELARVCEEMERGLDVLEKAMRCAQMSYLFTREVVRVKTLVVKLLQSVSVSEVTEAVAWCQACLHAEVDQAKELLVPLLKLVCSHDEDVRTRVVDLFQFRLFGNVTGDKEAFKAALELVDMATDKTVTEHLALSELLKRLVSKDKMPTRVCEFLWEIALKDVRVDGVAEPEALNLLVNTTQRAHALQALRMCSAGNSAIMDRAVDRLVALCKSPYPQLDPCLVQQIAACLTTLNKDLPMGYRKKLTLCAFLVDALTHSGKFLIVPRSCMYLTQSLEVRKQHLYDYAEAQKQELASGSPPALRASHLYRYQPEQGCSAVDPSVQLIPLTPKQAAVALTRQKVKVEGWFAMAHECLQALMHISPDPHHALECTAKMLLMQAMQVTAAQQNHDVALTNPSVKWRVCGHVLAHGYQHAVLHKDTTPVNNTFFVPASLPGLTAEGFPAGSMPGPIATATALLLSNTPIAWLPLATIAYAQSAKDDFTAAQGRFPPLFLLPSKAQERYLPPVGGVFTPIGPDVSVRHVAAATLLSRALFVAGVCATHMWSVLSIEEGLMRQAVNDAIREYQLRKQRSANVVEEEKEAEPPREKRRASLIANAKLSRRDRSEALGLLEDSEGSDDDKDDDNDGISGDSEDEASRKRKRKPAKASEKQRQSEDAAAAAADADDEETSRLEGETLARHEMRIEAMRTDAQARMAKDVHASFLAVFFPILKNILSHPASYDNIILRRTAAVTLARLMALSPAACADNMRLLVSLLKHCNDDITQCNIIVAFADLAARHPNAVQPYATHLYRAMHDTSAVVRKYAVSTVSYLVLNDIHKAKDPAPALAVCLTDTDDRVVELAKLFFQALHKKATAAHNPIFHALPDIISSLSHRFHVTSEQFSTIMEYLVAGGVFLKEKDCDTLVEKLCRRFQNFAQDVTAAVGLLDSDEGIGNHVGTQPLASVLQVLDFSDGVGVRVDVGVCVRDGAVSNCYCLAGRAVGCSAREMDEHTHLQCECEWVRIRVGVVDEAEARALQAERIMRARERLRRLRGDAEVSVEEQQQKHCRCLAQTLNMLDFGATGAKRLLELSQCFWPMLWDDVVYNALRDCIKRAQRRTGANGKNKDIRDALVELEKRMQEEYVKLQEERASLERGAQNKRKDKGSALEKLREKLISGAAGAASRSGKAGGGGSAAAGSVGTGGRGKGKTDSDSAPRRRVAAASAGDGKEKEKKSKATAKKPVKKATSYSDSEDEEPARSRRGKGKGKNKVLLSDSEEECDEE